MTEELKPCPFCGGTHLKSEAIDDIFFVQCMNIDCMVEGPYIKNEDPENIIYCQEEAAKAWNTRSSWQPIETAPKDGTEILGYGPWAGEINGIDTDPVFAICCYNGSGDYHGFCWLISGTDAYAAWLAPTHWQPLPPPPKEDK